MQRISHNGLVFYQFDSLNNAGGITHGLFTRLGGVSDAPFDTLNVGSTVGDDAACVQTNRERVAAALDFNEPDTRTTWQVHGIDIVVARQGEPTGWPPPKADAIITADRELPLVMRFADCVPLVLLDPLQQVIALSHAGWRGTLSGVGPATVKVMSEVYGCHPRDILVGIGPSIGPCCYEVGPEVIEQSQDVFGEAEGFVYPPSNGSGMHLDLWAANEWLLRRAGVEQVELAGICTACNTHEFFSHRAEKGKTGRAAVVIKLNGVQ